MRNMRRMHHDQLGHARQARPFPYGPNPQIACRICSRVFTSNQALVQHIQTHIRQQDEVVSLLRRRQGLISLLSSRTLLCANSYSVNLPNFPLFPPRQYFNNPRRRPYPPPHLDAPNPASFTPQQPYPHPSSFNSVPVPPTVPVISLSAESPQPPPSGSLSPPSPPSPQLQTRILTHLSVSFSPPSPQLQTTIQPPSGSQAQRRSPPHEPPPNDYTRAFLSQLEPEKENEYGEGSSRSSALDLTLKL